MNVMLRRVLWGWGAGLALLLCLVWLPLSPVGRWVGAVIILLCTLVGLFYRGRSRQRECLNNLSAVLPLESDRLPVVLVYSDIQDSLFGDELLRQTPQGYWLCLPSGTSLSDGVASLLAARPSWGGQLSVMAVINPQQYRDAAVLAGWVRELRWQLSQVRQQHAVSLPLLLAGYLAGPSRQPDDSPWFEWQSGRTTVTAWRAGASFQPLADWLEQGALAEQMARFQRGVELTSWADWMKAHVLPVCLTPEDGLSPCPPLAMVLKFVPALPHWSPDHVWQQWLQAKTALNRAGDPIGTSATGDAAVTLPFPDSVLRLLPAGAVQTPVQRAVGIALGLFLLAGITALGCSAWHNRQLLRQVESDLLHYQSIAVTDDSRKAQAEAVLRSDADRLEQYYRDGEPWRLGLGLYQGARLRPPLHAALADHHAKQREKTPVTPVEPQTISLNSLALFDVGQAKLKADSTKVLVNALMNVRAKPGWMILITGHTDSTGDATKNQALSLARAEAVRDWILQTSDIPLACFTVQGKGATSPIATNTTAAGRAANRRVEIRLIPRAAACARPQKVPDTLSTTSPLQATSLK
ncbi:OmpA family protein [Photorhabdus sp. APURE]|uniref:OmpA family protein n=1 Tax=Photorhabdus aballayi TaxID=2991723 RepID=UPI00223D0627|nr:OmpA family protein [Photorhabdus aballayi]MCW7550110.1 OmpA family protein [Photorhabdus aballayi]